jgi:hypothetical protein
LLNELKAVLKAIKAFISGHDVTYYPALFLDLYLVSKKAGSGVKPKDSSVPSN